MYTPVSTDNVSLTGHASILPKSAAESSVEVTQGNLHSEGNSWHPGICKHFPWLGFSALTITLLCCGSFVGILVVSDGIPVDSWALSPSVCLSIVSAVAVATLTFAYSEGVVISWWRKTLKGGTAGELHLNWIFGQSAWEAFTAGRKFNLVAAASLMTVVAFVSGPLLQKASHPVTSSITAPKDLSASLSLQLPYGYTSIIQGRGSQIGMLTAPFIEVLGEYTNRVPITTGFAGCNGNCSGTIKAAGLAVDCSTRAYTVDYNKIPNEYSGKPDPNNPNALTVEQLTFATNFTWLARSRFPNPQINMTVAFRSSSNAKCAGEVIVKNCVLRSSTVEYAFQIKQGVATLSKDVASYKAGAIQNSTANVGVPNALALVDSPTNGMLSTIGGLALVGNNMFSSNASYSFRGGIGWTLTQTGSLVQQYINKTASDKGNRGNCNATWGDPTDDIILSFHELMFRTAIKSANTSTYINAINSTEEMLAVAGPRQISVIQTSPIQLYSSDYRYLIGALVSILVPMMFVIATFWGFWELGRKFSMSPIETAKAFDAPALRGAGTNLPVDELLALYTETPLKYGAASDGRNGMTLRLGHSGIQKPARGYTFH